MVHFSDVRISFIRKSRFVPANGISGCQFRMDSRAFFKRPFADAEHILGQSAYHHFGAMYYWYIHVDNLVSTSRSRVHHGWRFTICFRILYYNTIRLFLINLLRHRRL